jgi:arabinosyltransferase C
MFLAVWLPLNNGLRPEPIIALGILATWCSVERGVATSRLLPVAVACILGTLTLFSGPTGIASIGALLVAIGPLRTIVGRRSRQFGLLPLLAPIVAAGTVPIILMFRDQTIAAVAQANALKRAVGPSLSWFDEHTRYERLMMATPDGSIARRFAVLALIIALAVTVAMMLRRGHIPGTAAGPSRRIIGITVISFLAIMFTPTKWTHHFGVFAGLAGSLGALAAIAVAPAVMRSRRNRMVFAAVVLFVVALSFASVNGWWYVSNFGVPWSNQFPQWRLGFTTVLLGCSVLALLVAAWLHFWAADPDRPDSGRRWARLGRSPLALAAWALVVFEVVTVNGDGRFPVQVLDVVIAKCQGLDVLIADPLPHLGEAVEPGVINPGAVAGNHHGGGLVVGGDRDQGVVKLRREAGKNGPDGAAIDEHGKAPVSR